MYADEITDSMRRAIDETNRRRKIQDAYNQEHGITPQTIKKAVRGLISISEAIENIDTGLEKDAESMSREEIQKMIKKLTKEMNKAAVELNFERAAVCRDQIYALKEKLRAE